ncbi:hypothetical protein E2562_027146, partial [Oryza meyeriana var. granulata]
MISGICWIPKGAAKNAPFVAQPPTQAEIDEAMNTVSLDWCHESDYDDEEDNMDVVDGAQDEDDDDVVRAKGVASALSKEPGSLSKDNSDNPLDYISSGLRELDMENYDYEDGGFSILGSGLGDLYYPTNDMDPYLKKNAMDDEDDDDDDDEEEIEDKTVKPSDIMIASVHNKDLYSYLQVLILEELEDGGAHMYPFHEILLPDFPLCLAWSGCNLKDGQKGNLMAVGTMRPEIEIWDLNAVEEFEPRIVLGGKRNKEGSAKRKGSHRDSVHGIAWNKEYTNILASASADKKVKIWDVAAGKCVTTLEHHDDKKDVKNCAPDCIRWPVEADVESVAWDPHNEHSFVVSLENGMVQGFDKRIASSNQNSSLSMFTIHAHEKAVSTISFGPSAPNLLATASTDKMVKLWDISGNQPSCIALRNPKVIRSLVKLISSWKEDIAVVILLLYTIAISGCIFLGIIFNGQSLPVSCGRIQGQPK